MAAGNRALHFDWPTPCEVEVTEKHVKRGNIVVSRYKATVEPAEEAGQFYVGRRKFEFISFNGITIRENPSLATQLAPVAAQLSARPRVLIDSNGSVLGMEDWTAYLDRLEPLMEEMTEDYSLNKKIMDSTMKLMRDPDARPLLASRASEFWNVWVSSWQDYDFEKAPSFRFAGEFSLPMGRTVRGPWEAMHHGEDNENPGYVRITAGGRLSGDSLVNAFRTSMKELSEKIPDSTPLPEDVLQSMSVESRAWVVLHPATMQPVKAYSEKRISFEADGKQNEEVESREYSFHW